MPRPRKCRRVCAMPENQALSRWENRENAAVTKLLR